MANLYSGRVTKWRINYGTVRLFKHMLVILKTWKCVAFQKFELPWLSLLLALAGRLQQRTCEQYSGYGVWRWLDCRNLHRESFFPPEFPRDYIVLILRKQRKAQYRGARTMAIKLKKEKNPGTRNGTRYSLLTSWVGWKLRRGKR